MRPGQSLVIVLLAVASTGCRAGYLGVVVEAPEQAEQAAATDRWGMVVDLERGDVVEDGLVQVWFEADQLDCEGGGALAPEDLPAGTRVRFSQEGTDVAESYPPQIAVVGVHAACD